MKKNRKILIVFVIIVILLTCIYLFKNKNQNYIDKQLHVTMPKVLNLEYRDQHQGFHRDGETFGKVVFNEINGENFASQVSINERWNKLPLTENVNLLMYGGEKNNIEYTDNFAQKLGIPQLSNGYWFFHDRHLNSNPSERDTDLDLLNRSSLNFTFALYDVDLHILYFFEFDT